MGIIIYLAVFFSFGFNLFIPANLNLVSPTTVVFNSIFYIISIMFFSLLIKKIVIKKKFNYDLLFLVLTLWISNFIGYIYFNIFNSFIVSWFCSIICLIILYFLLKDIKKINKSYSKYLILISSFYFYLLLFIFKFF